MENPKNPVRNSLYALAALVALGGVLFLMSAGESIEKLKVDCQHPNASKQECSTRMRAAGHADSLSGNMKKAEEWYLAAAKLGDEQSMFHLGWLYHMAALESIHTQGSMNRELIKQANDWYRKSARLGFNPAKNNLAIILFVATDIDSRSDIYDERSEGRMLMASAAANGNPVAISNLQNYKKETLSTKWDPKRAKPSDLMTPTLQRTFHGLNPLNKAVAEDIQEAAKNGEILEIALRDDRPKKQKVPFGMKEVEVNPNMPTFRETQEKIRREQQGR